MKIQCDECKQTGKGSYTSFYSETKIITLCDECRWGKGITRNVKSPEELFNATQIPFWKLMGQKPKPKDIVYEKYLKSRNMTYGDAVRERDHYHAREQSALPKFQHEINKPH